MRQRVLEAGQTDGAHTGETHAVWRVGIGREVFNIKRPTYGAVRARRRARHTAEQIRGGAELLPRDGAAVVLHAEAGILPQQQEIAADERGQEFRTRWTEPDGLRVARPLHDGIRIEAYGPGDVRR